MTKATDENLLQRIADGDQSAMERFYRRHSAAVYQFAMKTLHNGADAAEVLNEVMMEVWLKAQSFSGNARVSTWLLSITHHKAVDMVRRKSRHDGGQELQENTLVSSTCSLEMAQSGVENSRYVRRCMDELKSGHRQVVYLTFFEGYAYPEIAEVLQIPAGTVKTRMMHAKKLLMSCLTRLAGKGLVNGILAKSPNGMNYSGSLDD